MRLATRSSFVGFALVLVALLVTIAPRAEAQVDPLWDHYKVYRMNPPLPYPPAGPPISLTDQFGEYTHQPFLLELFANPVEKAHGGQNSQIHAPDLHYAWWRLDPHPVGLIVTAVNQFGDHTLHVRDGQFLWNPALKDEQGAPPVANHYKCYDCLGPPVNVQVGLVDQFGTWGPVMVTIPRFFCNPVEKRLGEPKTAQVYPIVDPNQHYVCYEYEPEHPYPFSATMTDQFVTDLPMDLHPSRLLCVPTYKSGVTDAARDTWGRLKILYR